MKEHKLRGAVQALIFDGHTPEGNTRNHFIAKFKKSVLGDVVDRSQLFMNVRHFIDGMHEYIMTNRGVELAKTAGWWEDNNSNRQSVGVNSDMIG